MHSPFLAGRRAASIILALLPGVLASAPVAAEPQAFVITDSSGQPVKTAALSVLVRGAKSSAPQGTTAQMSQRNKAFDPSLLVIQTGTQVSFPNFDTVRHHVYSFSPAKTFEIKLYSGTPSQPVLFDKPGTATLGCNIHDRMLAYIHIVDTPHFGGTDERGRVVIDVPAGEHLARIWTPAMGEKSIGQEVRFATSASTVTLRVAP